MAGRLKRALFKRSTPFVCCVILVVITWAFLDRGGLENQVNNILVWVVFAIPSAGFALASLSKDDDELQKKLVWDSATATFFALAFMPLAWVGVDVSFQWLTDIGFWFVPSYPIHLLLSPLAVLGTLAAYVTHAMRLRWPTKHLKPNQRTKQPSYVGFVKLPLIPF